MSVVLQGVGVGGLSRGVSRASSVAGGYPPMPPQYEQEEEEEEVIPEEGIQVLVPDNQLYICP